jgi:hypothetical protein
MSRSELVRRLILNAISDDYENVDQVILRQVAADGSKLGLAIGRAEVVDALAGLVEDGLAKAYDLSGTGPFCTELKTMPPLDDIEEDFHTYFYITKPGMDFHRSDDSWFPWEPDE